MALPLSDVTVIDLTRARAGPTCVRQLADMGARVIQVESPVDLDEDYKREGSDFQNLHRNKRSMTLNLKLERGVEIEWFPGHMKHRYDNWVGGLTATCTALLALDGLLEDMLADSPAVDVEDRFRAILSAARRRDKEAGRALEGPHRSDLLVWHGETRMPAGDCSTGQQKALLISIVLANARLLAQTGATPLLLLDEVVAHLDAPRRAV